MGLALALRPCRFQMIKIVKEVDAIEKRADYAADEKRGEAFQSPIAFRDRIPSVTNKQKLPQLKIFGEGESYPPLLERVEGDGANDTKIAKANRYAIDQPDADFGLRMIAINVDNGAVVGLSVQYANGAEIIACSIETGRVKGQVDAMNRVISLRLYTNRGPDLLGEAEDWTPAVNGKGIPAGIEFEDLVLKRFNHLLANGHTKGFWGYAVTAKLASRSGIYQLVPIWGNKESTLPTFEHRFSKLLPVVPTVIYGIRGIDAQAKNSPRVAINVLTISEYGFSLTAKTFLQDTQNVEANVMVLPNGGIPFQSGFIDTSDNPNGRKVSQNAKINVTFARSFTAVPCVKVCFTEISQPDGRRFIETPTSDFSVYGMTVNINPTEGWKANFNVNSGSDSKAVEWYGTELKARPKVFSGLRAGTSQRAVI
ncbi:hypothetical protein B0J13DRAFT_520026 [Dactylonectria estremocensis]|uniref:Uncharacterized protein n=1 Tax=Dactylonectria estremocensis TaxID=1079267 RepID=A0A9P9F8F6_9HYPO|nr:hypothetical protein B0J13DRAFT_520026 [Dactylonectria estremocensis]